MNELIDKCLCIAESLNTLNPEYVFTVDGDLGLMHQIFIKPKTADHEDKDFYLTLVYDQKTNRITVSANKPTSLSGYSFPYDHEEWMQPIKVASTRKADLIANDIVRRILTQYLAEYPDAAKRRDEQDEKDTQLSNRGHEIASVIGGELVGDRIKHGGPGGGNGSVREIYVSSDTVSINIVGIPFDTAKEMLQVWMNKHALGYVRDFATLAKISMVNAKQMSTFVGSMQMASASLKKPLDDDDKDFWQETLETTSRRLSELATRLDYTILRDVDYFLIRDDVKIKIPALE